MAGGFIPRGEQPSNQQGGLQSNNEGGHPSNCHLRLGHDSYENTEKQKTGVHSPAVVDAAAATETWKAQLVETRGQIYFFIELPFTSLQADMVSCPSGPSTAWSRPAISCFACTISTPRIWIVGPRAMVEHSQTGCVHPDWEPPRAVMEPDGPQAVGLEILSNWRKLARSAETRCNVSTTRLQWAARLSSSFGT